MAYQAALNDPKSAGLVEALARNVWRGSAPEQNAEALARVVLAQNAYLAAQSDADLMNGRVRFLAAQQAAMS
jgi:hypothetical protein